MASCQVSGSQDASSLNGSLTHSLARVKAFVEPLLETSLKGTAEVPPRLLAAMRHVLLAPGKRLRPALVLWAADACTRSVDRTDAGSRSRWEKAGAAAIAVEMIHAYSLVHDDLPAMDDDDLRRGLPTCHRAFDEATAILCGDALQALAFEILASQMAPAIAARGCLVLAQAAGAEALVGGQSDDLSLERGWVADLSTASTEAQTCWLERVHRRKTGALFLAALKLGGLSVGASAEQLLQLEAYGRALGLAFQIADDLLDAEGTEASVGKRVGKDVERGKLTFPAVVGLKASRSRGEALVREAVEALSGMGESAGELTRLAQWIIARDH